MTELSYSIPEEGSDNASTFRDDSETASETESAPFDKAGWFTAPVTDYMNLSTVVYPRSARKDASLAKLERHENVTVFYEHMEPKGWFAKAIKEPNSSFEIYVDSDNGRTADNRSTRFGSLHIKDDFLCDLLRPILESIHCPADTRSGSALNFQAPFSELFFAQGRILELFTRGGLSSRSRRRLGLLTSIVHVLLEKANREILEHANQRTINFEHIWSLFPVGALVVRQREIPHIYQIADAKPLVPEHKKCHKGDCRPRPGYRAFKMSSYGFDGYNIGVFHDYWDISQYEGVWAVDSLLYRPVEYERRYVDQNLLHNARTRGRKMLELQNIHVMDFDGEGEQAMTDDKVKTRFCGRVVVDAKLYHDEDKEQGLSFEYIDPDSQPVRCLCKGHAAQVRKLYDPSIRARPNALSIADRSAFYGQHEDHLLTMKPLVPAFSLELNKWFWVDVMKLTPTSWDSGELVLHDTLLTERALLLEQLLQAHLDDVSAAIIRKPESFVVAVTGPRGSGKTRFVQKLADRQMKPLMTVRSSDPAAESEERQEQLARFLMYAREWDAFVHVENADRFIEFDASDWTTDRSGAASCQALKNHPGVIILTKMCRRPIIHELNDLVRARIHWEDTRASHRETIWATTLGEELEPYADTISCDIPAVAESVRQWRINGYEIRNLVKNALCLMRARGKSVLSVAELENATKLNMKHNTTGEEKRRQGRRCGSSHSSNHGASSDSDEAEEFEDVNADSETKSA